MAAEKVGALWWDINMNRADSYTLWLGFKTDEHPGIVGIGVGLLQQKADAIEYIHYGPEILPVLTYEGISLEDAKVAVETAVKLRCNLGGTQ